MEEVSPKEEEYRDWLSHPVTQEFRELLRNWREDLKAQWEQGNFVGTSWEVTALANAEALGQVNMLKKLLELDAQQLEEGLKNE